MDEKRPPSFFQFRLGPMLFVVGLLCVVCAVWNRPSIDHIWRVMPGMTKEDVIRLVGEPSEVRLAGYELWHWGGDYVVRFDRQRVSKICDSSGWRGHAIDPEAGKTPGQRTAAVLITFRYNSPYGREAKKTDQNCAVRTVERLRRDVALQPMVRPEPEVLGNAGQVFGHDGRLGDRRDNIHGTRRLACRRVPTAALTCQQHNLEF